MNVIWNEPKSMVSGNKPADIVEPFEDWEQAMRDPKSAKGARVWKPVFVELNRGKQGDYTSTLQSLVNHMIRTDKGKTLQYDRDFLAVVVNIIVGELAGENVERFTRFFLYRPEAIAYDSVLGCETLHIGVGIPISRLVTSGNLDGLDRAFRGAKRYARHAASGEMPAVVQHHYVLDRPLCDKVVTGYVDDEISVANERFRCETEEVNSTAPSRIDHYWRQSWSVSRTGAALEFGHSSNGSDLSAEMDDMIYDGAVDEVEFYRLLNANKQKSIAMAAGKCMARNINRPLEARITEDNLDAQTTESHSAQNPSDARPVMFVQLPKLASDEPWAGRLEFYVLTGVIRLLRWADNWKDNKGKTRRVAVVINISYKNLSDATDGTGFLEREIRRLARLRNAEGVATAVVMSNDSATHESQRVNMRLPCKETDVVNWQIQPEVQAVSFVEVWLEQLNRATLVITGPGGDQVDLKLTRSQIVGDDGSIARASYTVDRKRLVTGRGEFVISRAYVRRFGDTAKTQIVVAFAPSLNRDNRGQSVPTGDYRLELTNEAGAPLHAEITLRCNNSVRTVPDFAPQPRADGPGIDGISSETEVARNVPLWTVGRVARLGAFSAYPDGSLADVYVVGGTYDQENETKRVMNSKSVSADDCDVMGLPVAPEEQSARSGVLTSGLTLVSSQEFDAPVRLLHK
ncbi:hypothetical protein TRL7639_04237 [Falsiruegeria litorea R37]|uniref:Uncharacterized protein n=2 Tax=Falsiruegeria litorea TaxID=1280831 RepID=A0A1Y5TTR4_9RHOB|nr:hypothetical protein TRL7639_04237 [Falsiruegeria litorea R37]